MTQIIYDTIEEAETLKKFKKLVEDLGQDENICLRFLRARNHDLRKAEEMLRKSIEWRKDKQVDVCDTWVIPDPIVKEFKYWKSGLDNEGRAVIYLPVGKWEVRKFIEDGWKDDMMKNIIVVLENIMKYRKESKMNQFFCIVDVGEMTYYKVAHYETIQMILQVFRDFESNYPETLFKATVINAPWVFSYIFPIVRPLISSHTMSKVNIFDANSNKWRAALLAEMPVESIPVNSCP